MNMSTINESTQRANTETLLTPRFYSTDATAFDRLDLSEVRDEWDQMMAEFEMDANEDHFVRPADFAEEIRALPPGLEAEFIDFMISSVTSEYSGCALYADLEEAVQNPDVKRLMKLMTRDEARHAGFINRSLKDYGRPVDLGYLRRHKKTKFFQPKFIYYATYLSEKIGYARYITIFRQLERHPERRFHPIFKWFERWCNDEFRHGEAFAMIMRANPALLRGHNTLWIRFFLVAVFATMYVRDHTRPEMHRALGFDPTDYDYRVFHITSEISRQVFPFTLDLDNPRFRELMDRLRQISAAADEAKGRRGLAARLQRAVCGVRLGLTFARLYLLPVIPNELPQTVRLRPAW